MKPYWTDNEMMLMMLMCFLLGFGLNWIIRTYKELNKGD